MHNLKSFLLSVVFLCGCVPLFGCSTTSKNNEMENSTSWSTIADLKPIKQLEPVKIEFKGDQGKIERTKYYSSTSTDLYDSGQLIRQRETDVEFLTESRYQKTENPDQIFFEIETILKNGSSSLHDMAFPELKEIILFELNKNGEVQRAGNFPKSSLFYISPLPLPKDMVTVGDTWEYKHQWLNVKNSVPMILDMVVIFKNLVSCGNDQCADLELAGSVTIGNEVGTNLQLDSLIKGRVLFALNEGSVLDLDVKNKESIVVFEKEKQDQIIMKSCLRGRLLNPPLVKNDNLEKFECDPGLF